MTINVLDRGYAATRDVFAAINGAGWDTPSACADWSVRQCGNHLVASVRLLARVAEGETVPPADFDARSMADTDNLGTDPAGAFAAVAKRSVAAFARPGALTELFGFPPGPTPGLVLANISLMEAVVHGWDLARGADVPYPIDAAVVAALGGFVTQAIGDEQRKAGLFGPKLPVAPDANPLTGLLAHLGRSA
ncbi:MAG TPA: TIGR03086 family metal-binding protein [Micromonosporaceae bacterium]|jgi:uncharacterized protein (TIGR03086 family)|nr:TIGR03086 family metal-binding protein [Micromonosporaceae bacterium]